MPLFVLGLQQATWPARAQASDAPHFPAGRTSSPLASEQQRFSPSPRSQASPSLSDWLPHPKAPGTLGQVTLRPKFVPAALPPGTEGELVLHGVLTPGWHLYGLRAPSPLATRLELQSIAYAPHQKTVPGGGDIALVPIGAPLESAPETLHDSLLAQEVDAHRHSFTFRQRLRLPQEMSPGQYVLDGVLRYHVCDQRVCSLVQQLPFAVTFRVTAS